jgi:hypothetical protein
MDKHLNLFFSYDQGYYKKSVNKKEKVKQLEDNITRALIAVLSNISIKTRKKIIKELISTNRLKSKEFDFDLQNTQINHTKKKQKKYLILIQKIKTTINKENFEKIKKRKEKIKDGNRPDGWIIGDKEVALIESKIENYPLDINQIYRHLTGVNGFNLSPKKIMEENSEYYIIQLTWQEIAQIFKKQKLTEENDILLINELLIYLSMTGQILNFDYLISGMMDDDVHKNQMRLFLEKLDKTLDSKKIDLKREKRKLDGLWDYYGINKGGNISQDPHYTIRFFNESINIILTTKKEKHKQVKRLLSNKEPNLKGYISNKINEIDNRILVRYYLRILNYPLVDYRGQRKGDKYDGFNVKVRFSEIDRENIDKVINNFAKMADLKIYRQFELGLSIDFNYNFSKIKEDEDRIQLKKENLELLKNPDELLKLFADFIEETKDLFDAMYNS